MGLLEWIKSFRRPKVITFEIAPDTLELILRKSLNTITLYINNQLNQPVTVQVKGNITNSASGLVDIGSSFTVSASTADAKTLSPDTCGFLPYITVSLSCSTAPTSGSVSIYRVRSKTDIATIVNSLPIRDTNTHDPTTDPTVITIVEW